MYLGLDIGTSSVKAVLVDDNQIIVDQASSSQMDVHRPAPLHAEQNPDLQWWIAVNEAILTLSAKGRAAVKSIGLSGQMHGAVCLDKSDKVLRPAILWNDGRSASQCMQMMETIPHLTSITGNLAMPGFTAPKLAWMRDNEPDLFKRTAKVLLPKDYIRLKMCGVYASDMSDSAGTLWMDVAKRDWSDDVLSQCDLSRKNMPDLFEGSDIAGTLRAEIADQWGMEKVPVAAGGGDNAAGAVGAGTINPRDGFISLGTSGVVFSADDGYLPNPSAAVHAFCHALPGLWHRMAVILSAASAVDFVSKMTGFTEPSELFGLLDAQRPIGTGPIFLPYLSGERTPHNNPSATGAFFGLTFEHTSADLGAAAVEGVSFALADGFDAIKAAGDAPTELSIIGGGARSAYWAEILATVFDLPLHIRDGASVGPAFGAARLARLGLTGESAKSVCTPPAIEQTIAPNPEWQSQLAPRRETFKTLYTRTKDLMS
jgi:xylulokinase